ncbi:MAG TPA: helix-turn-helix domain-containing protein [Candidatus Marinimicrobia bacterium]|jgi:cytoskeletal protein RodZ|nr:helix-turn-helix domain-containing protein [Candidatus Neomarinimicrobiota bacterium]MDP7217299.1 helix-turn-helix domain-containing protein [Candidatus Neomarinimicrobiota bacterium]MDP7437016.1 helix-turn-helix domain-containing protein [Candidatus Neomarinimicrobiota bacterium]HJL74054.1 helix-turn-helix domain-containing protein [Candidatus Neomarinimicrobiota bacterium]HJM69927.1 helix-turn-helix domain-containing protein [Candidatus Neomarinimicrobiota bacterium]|tara:strand:+ start:13070 stop:13894 length:825 start_codon:yes stop_codon:yes gene_type:complete
MSEFYTELKELRESQNIDLEEIHSRTKINMEYLTAIENGQFDVLPLPYVRLFMRAYVTEIGGEADEALHQLDIFQGRKVGKRISRKVEKVDSKESKKEIERKVPTQSRPPTKVRQDLIKGGLLLIIFLFAIFIIKKINEEQSSATIKNGEIVLAENPDAISDDQLVNDYVEAVSQTVSMIVEPPLKLKIVTAERIWYSMAADTAAAQTGILSPGEEKSLAFENQINVRLNQTAGTAMYINGMEVEELGEFQHPAEIYFFAEPSTITVKHYLPQR